MNEIVKIHNDLTNEKISKLSEKELDLFMAICYKLKNQGTNKVTISFQELKTLAKYKTTGGVKRLEEDIDEIIDNMFFVIKIKDGTRTRHTVLFEDFYSDIENKTVEVEVKPEFQYIFSNITKEFTRFELEEFVSLDSKYSKRLYKLLKQWRTQGKYQASKEKLYNELDVPKNYNNSNFNLRVLNPSLKECSRYIKELKCEKIKGGKGGAIQGYIFTFVKEIPTKDDENQEQAKQSFKTTRAKEKQNKFNQMELASETYKDIDIDELEQAILSN